MKEFWNTIQLVFAAIGGWLGYFLGGCDGLLIALVIFVVCDYLRAQTIAKKMLDDRLISVAEFNKLTAINRETFSPLFAEIVPEIP